MKIRSMLSCVVLAVALFIGLDRFVHRGGVRFRAEKVTTHHYSPEWEIPPLTSEQKQEIDAILNQEFSYLGKGSQSHVFITADKKHVLKLFKQNKWTPKTWLAYLPLPFNPLYKDYLQLKEKERRTLHACKLAFTDFRNETGLVYIHLNRTNSLHKTITLTDKKGKPHTLCLDHVGFVIQKRADMIYPRIAALMNHKDIEGAKQVISSLLSLLDYLGEKGVVDNDPILRKNFGLINDVAVQIDVGRMYIDPNRIQSHAHKQEIADITTSFRKWLTQNYPELLPAFEETLSQLQNSYAS